MLFSLTQPVGLACTVPALVSAPSFKPAMHAETSSLARPVLCVRQVEEALQAALGVRLLQLTASRHGG